MALWMRYYWLSMAGESINKKITMKAIELKKASPSLESIYENIEGQNKCHNHKVFYPHWVYFSDECKLELIRQGFKVSEGEWVRGDYGLIIEW